MVQQWWAHMERKKQLSNSDLCMVQFVVDIHGHRVQGADDDDDNDNVLHSTTGQWAYNQLNSHWLIISSEAFEDCTRLPTYNTYNRYQLRLCCCSSWFTHLLHILIAIYITHGNRPTLHSYLTVILPMLTDAMVNKTVLVLTEQHCTNKKLYQWSSAEVNSTAT